MTVPNERRQFRILYRDSLYRMIDLELLSASGDIHKLLAQFAALLAALNLFVTFIVVPRFALSILPQEKLAAAVSVQVEFMIATTMAVASLFALLAWNSVLPDRRDCFVLRLLPVRSRTIFLAKVAAIGTALGISVVATNVFTGLSLPFVALKPEDGWFGAMRSLAAYWLTVVAAGLFVCSVLLAVQGLAAEFLSYRKFQRLSGFIQFSAFFLIFAIYFFKPSIADVQGFSEAGNLRTMGWVPSFWFFGLFQQMKGAADSSLDHLASRALSGLLLAGGLAAGTFALAFRRVLRSIVEEPDISPQDRSRPATLIGTFLTRRSFALPLERAIILFTARTVARSRQHRLLLAAHGGIGLATALVYVKDVLRGSYTSVWDLVGRQPASVRWDEPSIPSLAASLILLVFSVTGVRAIFPLPLALSANWVFRITQVHKSVAYFAAVRRSLYALAGVTVWILSAVFFLAVWPVWSALQHIAVLFLVGVWLVENSLHEFQKIPFACSYLPGKANLNVKLGVYALAFLFFADRGVAIELWAMHDIARWGVLLAVLCTAAVWARHRTSIFAAGSVNGPQFEDVAPAVITTLDLNSAGTITAREAYARALGEVGASLKDAEIDEEREFRVRMAAEDHKALGESPTEARYSALRELRNLTRIKEDVRAVWRENSMELLWQDLRIAVRSLMKSPIFTGAAVVLIALGIGVNGSVFSLFHSIMHRPMSGVTASNLVSLGVAIDGREDDPGNTWTNYLAYKESSKAFRRLTAWGFERFTLGMEGASYALRGGLVTPDYFDTLGVRLAVGRSFTTEEGNPEAGGLVAVISHQLWREQFEGAQGILGRQVLLSGHAATVIGVAPPKFRGIQLGEQNDVWVPILSYSRLHHRERVLNDPANRFIEIIGQLANGVTLAEAQAELDVISKRLEETYPDQNRRFRALVAPYTAIGLGLQSLRFVLKVLLMFAGLFLMVICANVANLILSRSLERQHEMAVRKSLGAPLSRLVSLLLAEGLVMSILAALVGWGVATWATPIIVSLSPGAPPSLDLSPDPTVALYALLQAIIATLVFTTLPALGIWRQDPLSSLKSRQATVSLSGKRFLTALTVVQLTACVVLLSGAGLLLRSSRMLDDFDAGFKRRGLLFLSVDTAGAAKDSAANARLLGELWNRLRSLPGIQAVSYAVYTPLAWQSMSLGLVKGDVSTEPARADFNVVGPGYLTALGAPMRLGRDISDTDREFSTRVAVVNENMAQALWPGRNPLGRTIEVPAGERMEVVGVVANGSFSDIRQGAKPNMVFVSFAQQPQESGGVFHIRHSQALQSLMPSIRASIHQQNSQVAIAGTVTAEQRLRESMPLQFLSVLITVFAVAALLVAGIGLYGLVALNMTRRTREFAIRIAVGATSREIWLEALRGGTILTAVGLGAGLLLSVLGSQALRSVLFGVSPTDAVTYAFVTAVLALTCVAACLLPARRATRIDPAKVLRQEY